MVWLAPALFGLRLITFWQALGLLALCRILFGGLGLGGGGHRNSRRRIEGRIRERIRERMDGRWEQMTPEERENSARGFMVAGGALRRRIRSRVRERRLARSITDSDQKELKIDKQEACACIEPGADMGGGN